MRSLTHRFAKLWAAVLCLLLTIPSYASARYLGSDPFNNIGLMNNVGGLAGRYPLYNYAIDYHVDFGVTNPEGFIPLVRQAAAQQLWDLITNTVWLMIQAITYAFNLDIITGPNGALGTVATSTQALNSNLQNQGWLFAAVIVAGGWGMWTALGKRNLAEMLSKFLVSLLCAVVCMVIIINPVKTIGGAATFANNVSNSFLGGFGVLAKGENPRQHATDHLFLVLIYDPWVVTEFGGLSHCVDTTGKQQDDFPTPVAVDDPHANVCRDHVNVGKDGFGGYAKFWLRYPPNSDQRDAEYDALRQGEVPTDADKQEQFKNRNIDKNDSPAVDIQQAGGALSRIRMVGLIALGAIAIVLLFGRIAITVLVAQVVALFLFALAPIALIVGIFPWGHGFFKWWLTRLFTAIFIKAIYALVLSIMIGVSEGVLLATNKLGVPFIVSFGVQTIVFWIVLLKRKTITAELAKATSGQSDTGLHDRHRALTAATVLAATRPVRMMLRGNGRGGGGNGTGPGPNAGKDTVVDDDDVTPTSDDGGQDPRWQDGDDGTPPTPGPDGGTPGPGGVSVQLPPVPQGGRGRRSYRVVRDPEELADMGGDATQGGQRVAWALVGTEHDPHVQPTVSSEPVNDADSNGDASGSGEPVPPPFDNSRNDDARGDRSGGAGKRPGSARDVSDDVQQRLRFAFDDNGTDDGEFDMFGRRREPRDDESGDE